MKIVVPTGLGRAVTELLGLLASTPSTPDQIAEEARRAMGDLEARLPPRRHGPDPGEEVEVVDATRVAGLLDLLSGAPSTPPGVRDDAQDLAAALWDRIQ